MLSTESEPGDLFLVTDFKDVHTEEMDPPKLDSH